MVRLWCLVAPPQRRPRELRLFVNAKTSASRSLRDEHPTGGTGPRRRRIGSHSGDGRFMCGGSFAAHEQPLPIRSYFLANLTVPSGPHLRQGRKSQARRRAVESRPERVQARHKTVGRRDETTDGVHGGDRVCDAEGQGRGRGRGRGESSGYRDRGERAQTGFAGDGEARILSTQKSRGALCKLQLPQLFAPEGRHSSRGRAGPKEGIRSQQ